MTYFDQNEYLQQNFIVFLRLHCFPEGTWVFCFQLHQSLARSLEKLKE